MKMNTFIINIVTTTKTKELYELVAVNEYPIVVRCENEERLQEILKGEAFTSRIKDELKTKTLYDQGLYYIREILKDSTKDFTYKVPDYTIVEY